MIVEESADLAAQTRYLVSGAADNRMILWDVSKGKALKSWEFATSVKRVAWRYVSGFSRPR